VPASILISTIISGAAGFALGAGGLAAFTTGALLAGLKAGVITGALGGMLQMVTGAARQSARQGGSGPRRENVADSIPARWILGRQRVSGQIIFLGEDPDNGLAFHMMMVLCEGAIEGIEKLYVNGEEVPLVISKTELAAVPGRVINDQTVYAAPTTRYRPDRDGDGHIVVHISGNAEGRNETNLGAKFQDWQATDKLEGLSYAHITLWQDGDREKPFYRRIPNIEFLVKGIKIALPTAGATGEAAPVWSDNAADIRYWWLRVRRGYAEEDIDRASYRAARAVCGTQITRAIPPSLTHLYPSTHAQYTINGVVDSADDAAEIESLMDFNWQGTTVERGDGKIHMMPGTAGLPELTITEDWIKARGPLVVSPPIQERYNGYTARIVQSHAHGYQEVDVQEFIDTDARRRDGEARTADLGPLPFTTDSVQATWLMVVQARRARNARSWSYAYMPSAPNGVFSAMQVFPGMTVQFTDSEYGLTNQLAYVRSTEIQPTGGVDVVLEEIKANFFSPELTVNPGVEAIPFLAIGGSTAGLYLVNGATGSARTVSATGNYSDMFSSAWEGGHLYRYDRRKVERIEATNAEIKKVWNITGGSGAASSTAMSSDGVVFIKPAAQAKIFKIDLKTSITSLDDDDNIVNTVTASSFDLRTDLPIWGLTFIGDTLYGIYSTTSGPRVYYLCTFDLTTLVFSTVFGGDLTYGLRDTSMGVRGMCTLGNTIIALVSTITDPKSFFIYKIDKDTGVWSKFLDDAIEGLASDNASIEVVPSGTVSVAPPETPPVGFTVSTLDDGTRRYSWRIVGREVDIAGVKIRYALTDAAWDDMNSLHEGLLTFSPWESQLPLTANNVDVWFEIRTVDHGSKISSVGSRTMARLGPPPSASVGNFRGDWMVGVAYKERDIVRLRVVGGDETVNGLYICTEAHTSTTSNKPPAETYWDLYLLDGRYGEDGLGVEYIFTRTTDPTLTRDKHPLNTWKYDEPGTVGGQTWTDNVVSVDATTRFLWQASRRVTGQPNTGDDVPADWTLPVIISSWGSGRKGDQGIPGADGEDGQGFEYIFAVTNNRTLPLNQRPLDTWLFDAGGTRGGVTWSDGAPEVTKDNQYLWRSQRTIMGDISSPGTNDANLTKGTWTVPQIISSFGVGIDGADGADGQGFEYIFTVTAEDTLSSDKHPLDTWLFDAGGTRGGVTWSDGAPPVSATMRYLWRSQRTIMGDISNPGTSDANLTKGTWTTPQIVSAWGSGIKGADGFDGQGYEYIFAITNTRTLQSTQKPNNAWLFDAGGTAGGLTWYDGAPDVTSTMRFLWRSQRTVMGDISSPGANDANLTKGTWTDPKILSTWGSGVDGADGADGQGYEYVFAVTTNSNAIPVNQRPENTWKFDRPQTRNGLRWTDGAQDVTRTNRYLWRCERVVSADLDPGDTVPSTSTWGPPHIVGAWGNDGVSGSDGADGQGFEYIFAVNNSDSAISSSQRPLDSWLFDRPQTRGGLRWTDGAQGVSETNRYLWRSQRTIRGDIDNRGTRDANLTKGRWTTPTIVSTWGSGVDGEDGDDGAGVEYIFAKTAKTVTRIPSTQLPLATWKYEQPGTRGGLRWTDGGQELSKGEVLWRSERRVEGSPAVGSTVSPGTWSTPVIVGAYGDDGDDGDDGEGTETIYCRVTSVYLVSATATTKSLKGSTNRGFWPRSTFRYKSTRTQLSSSSTGYGLTLNWFSSRPQATKDRPYVFSSDRAIKGSPAVGSTITPATNWSRPVLIGEYTAPTEPEDPSANTNGVYYDLGDTRIAYGFFSTRSSSGATRPGEWRISVFNEDTANLIIKNVDYLPYTGSPHITAGSRRIQPAWWTARFAGGFRSTPTASTAAIVGQIQTRSLGRTSVQYRIRAGTPRIERGGSEGSVQAVVYPVQSVFYQMIGTKPS